MNSLSYLSSKDTKNIVYTDIQVLPVIDKAASLLKKTYTNCDIQYHGDPSMQVKSNEIYLHIVVKNLLENALKYSLKDRKVDIHLYADESKIEIKDYGQGMSPEEIKKI